MFCEPIWIINYSMISILNEFLIPLIFENISDLKVSVFEKFLIFKQLLILKFPLFCFHGTSQQHRLHFLLLLRFQPVPPSHHRQQNRRDFSANHRVRTWKIQEMEKGVDRQKAIRIQRERRGVREKDGSGVGERRPTFESDIVFTFEH